MTRVLAVVFACVIGPALAHDNPADWDWIGKGRVKNEKGELGIVARI